MADEVQTTQTTEGRGAKDRVAAQIIILVVDPSSAEVGGLIIF